MGATYTIFKRELRSYFDSPVAYVLASVFIVLIGWLFFSTFFVINQASLRGFFSLSPIFFMVLTPMLTMRLIAEERKTGYIEVLSTMPVQEWQVITGKYLAALALLGVLILLTLPLPIGVSAVGDLDWGPVVAGYLGLGLMGAGYLSVGILASTITRNQIIAVIVGWLMALMLWVSDKVTVVLPAPVASVFEYLSVDFHFQNIARGVIDTRDLLYYASLIVVGLMVSTYLLAARRWR
jgi:ABC-2 type transport system permease protein